MRGSRFTQPARSEALPTLGSSQPLSLPSASTLGPSELLSCFGVGATRLQARPQLLKVGAGSGGVDAPLSLAATAPSRAFAAVSASALGGSSGSSVLTGSKTTVIKASAAVARLHAATQRVVLQAAGFNLGLVMRKLMGAGTPKRMAAALVAFLAAIVAFIRRHTTTNAANGRSHHNRSWCTPTALTQRTFPQIRVSTSAC